MNDSTSKKKRRRRRGGSRRKGKSDKAQTPETTAKAPQTKESGGSSKGRGASQKKGGRSGRRDDSRAKGNKAPAAESFADMVAAYPPEYSRLPEFIKQCRHQRGKEDEFTEDEFFYFITTSIETLTEDKLDELYFSKYAEPLKEIRLREGLEEDHFWKPDDPSMPEDYRQLLDEFRTEKREILAKMFQNFGESELGEMVVDRHSEYLEQREKGKADFYSRHKFEAV
ncbi:MAG: hypothetical protein KC964_03270, partial [Candidatus Omnitrophica bacterium]|nr:hypothetical protein [Candidatus Omnitrophota bacterium]